MSVQAAGYAVVQMDTIIHTPPVEMQVQCQAASHVLWSYRAAAQLAALQISRANMYMRDGDVVIPVSHNCKYPVLLEATQFTNVYQLAVSSLATELH